MSVIIVAIWLVVWNSSSDEFHFMKRRSTEALYEQQQQIQHDIRKAEEEMIDLEMRRNIEIEMVDKGGK